MPLLKNSNSFPENLHFCHKISLLLLLTSDERYGPIFTIYLQLEENIMEENKEVMILCFSHAVD